MSLLRDLFAPRHPMAGTRVLTQHERLGMYLYRRGNIEDETLARGIAVKRRMLVQLRNCSGRGFKKVMEAIQQKRLPIVWGLKKMG